MSHLGDANKMVDTPRTTDRVVFIDGNPWVNAPFARELERELNAANERIKHLEAVVNDPEVLWSNWLRGTVKLPSGIGDVRQYQARIKRLVEAAEAIAKTRSCGCPYGESVFYCRTCVSAWDAWEEAKEAKP